MVYCDLTLTSRPWWESLTDLSFFAMFVFASFPETLIGKMYVGPFPFVFLLYYIGTLSTVLEWKLSGNVSLRGLTRVSLFCFVAMLLCGLAKGEAVKWIMIDCSAFIGLIMGLNWGMRRDLGTVIELLKRVGWMVVLLLLFTVIGLKLHLIPVSSESGRTYVKSLFFAAFFLSVLVPFLWGACQTVISKKYPPWMVIAGLLGATLILLLSSFATTTRSIAIAGMLGLFLSVPMICKGYKGLLLIGAPVLLFLIVFLLWREIAEVLKETAIAERFLKTKGSGEHRWLEVMMLVDQIKGSELFTGMGFGSRFHSVVVVDGTDLAIVPHIAIFAFLQKGGIGLFLIWIVIPFVYYSTKFLFGSGTALQRGCWGGILMYLFFCSMSGGWDFHRLFLYGTFISVASREQPFAHCADGSDRSVVLPSGR